MSAGAIVISSRHPGSCQLIENGKNGYLLRSLKAKDNGVFEEGAIIDEDAFVDEATEILNFINCNHAIASKLSDAAAKTIRSGAYDITKVKHEFGSIITNALS